HVRRNVCRPRGWPMAPPLAGGDRLRRRSRTGDVADAVSRDFWHRVDGQVRGRDPRRPLPVWRDNGPDERWIGGVDGPMLNLRAWRLKLLPPARRPVTFGAVLPLLVFLLVFIGACLFMDWRRLVV